MIQYFVEIRSFDNDEEPIKKMGPMSEWKAEKVECGAMINLNHEKYYTVIVPIETPEGE